MKYIEFQALNAVLENKGSNLNEFINEASGLDAGSARHTGGQQIIGGKYDEENTLDVSNLKEKGIPGWSSPRMVIYRKKVINKGKQFLKVGNEKFITPLLSKNLEHLKTIANQATGLANDGKTPEQVLNAMKSNTELARKTQEKAMERLNVALDKAESHYEATTEKLIKSNTKLSDKSKNRLSMYWMILSAQVRQKLFSAIINKTTEFTSNLTKNNPELQKVIDDISGQKNWKLELEKEKKKVDEAKKKFKATSEEKIYEKGEQYKYPDPAGEVIIVIDEVKENGDLIVYKENDSTKKFDLPKTSSKYKNIGEKLEGEKVNSTEKSTPRDIKVGEKYKYKKIDKTSGKEKEIEVEIQSVDADGTIKVKSAKNPNGFAIKKEKLGLKIE